MWYDLFLSNGMTVYYYFEPENDEELYDYIAKMEYFECRDDNRFITVYTNHIVGYAKGKW